MKQKAEQVVRSYKECMADTYWTYKNGRLCVPVKRQSKQKVSGSVIEKSSTGNTLFIEPVFVAKYYEEIQLLRIEEENEVFRILYSLTAMINDFLPVMEQNMIMMEKLDFIFSSRTKNKYRTADLFKECKASFDGYGNMCSIADSYG